MPLNTRELTMPISSPVITVPMLRLRFRSVLMAAALGTKSCAMVADSPITKPDAASSGRLGARQLPMSASVSSTAFHRMTRRRS